jgi:hypothetical protein
MSSELHFFCTWEDLLLCMKEVEAAEQLHYYPAVSSTPDLEPALTIGAPALDPAALKVRQLLVARRRTQVRARTLGRAIEHPWYAFDLLENPDAVMLDIGHREGEVLTPGRLSTLGQSSESISLFKNSSKHFKKKCQRVKSYWVGPEALALLRAGTRLAVNETASRIYDLREN